MKRITFDINLCTFTARVGTDPEKKDAGGHDLCSFRIAVSRWNKKAGEADTDWYTVNVWGDAAKHAMQMIEKGQAIVVKGRLAMQTWTNKEGVDQISPTISADNIFVLGAENYVKVRDSDDAPGGAPVRQSMPEDDLPF